jgi:DNA ligase-associated metallophosphoesterase
MLRPMADLMPETAPSLRSHISVAGHDMRPLAAGALYWEDEDTLLVADLHLEKGAAFAALGMLLPPYDTRTTLERLSKVMNAVNPSRVVALGDNFHRSHLADQLASDDLDFLLKLQQGREWYWICGNHDPHLPPSIGGYVCATLTIRGITLRHEPSPSETAREIAGHLHPVARISRRGSLIRRRCFATDGNRLIMPAFGAYTGGLNVLDEAFGTLFLRHRLEAWMMGRAQVYPVLGSLLLPD